MYPAQYTNQYDYGVQDQQYDAYGWTPDYASFEESNGAYHVYYSHHRGGPVYFDQQQQQQQQPTRQQQPPQHQPHHHQHQHKHRHPHHRHGQNHQGHGHTNGQGHGVHHGQHSHYPHQQQQQIRTHPEVHVAPIPQAGFPSEADEPAPPAAPRVYSEEILKSLQNRGRNPARTVIASDVFVQWGTYQFSQTNTVTQSNGTTPAETPSVKKQHWQKPAFGVTGPQGKQQMNGRGQNGGRRDPSAVCLDFLKGVCNDKRYKCKYVHPPMPLGPTLVEAPASGDSVEQKQEVCDVWILTGFCKFGEKCRFFHPVLDESSTPMCSPAFTAKMAPPRQSKGTKKSRHDGARGHDTFDAALADSSDESSDDNKTTPVASGTASPALSPTKSTSEDISISSPLSPLGLGLDATVRKINGILNRITAEKFASLSQQLLEMVNLSDTCLMRALPLIFAKGCAEEEHGEIYAQLCKTLYNGATASQRHAITSTLLQLGSRLLYNVDEVVAALAGQEEQLFKLQLKRIGNIRFLGELFLEELLHLNSVLEIVTFLETKSFRNSDKADAALHIELLCKFLSTVGERVDTLWPGAFDIYYRNLQHAAARHATRVQVLIQNLCEWRHVHCWARV